MEENQIELDDLPDDCIAEILKKLKTRVHRNDARSVCKFWQHLIDSDSSSERYLVNRRTTGRDHDWTQPKFRNFISQFLNFNRKKISFRFDDVDLRNTEHFWTEKGVHIIGLNFDNWCKEIPLERVFSECIQLREMCIHYSTDQVIDAFESLAAKEICNYSLHFLTIDPSTFGKISVERAIQLVGLTSKVFPHMRKITLCNFEDINGQYEELSKKFIQLKCELELDTNNFRVVFDSSSKTPISLRKVSIDDWTMLPHEYYKHLEDITYSNTYTSSDFKLSQLENIFSLYPVLQTLDIFGFKLISDLRKPITNRLKLLCLCSMSYEKFTLGGVLLESFKFLKVFHIENVSRASFADILLNMVHLEDLFIINWIAVDDECEISKERKLIVHENLMKLTIPSFFSSRTQTIYRFNNLMKITVQSNGIRTKSQAQNVDNILLHFQCPNLKHMWFYVEMITSKAIDSLWWMNLMSMFPKLERYSFCLRGSDDLITDDQKLALCQLCPKLSVLDQRISMEIIKRRLFLT